MSKQKQPKKPAPPPDSRKALRKQLTVKDATANDAEILKPEHWLSLLVALGLVGWGGYCMFLPLVMYVAAIGFIVCFVAMVVQLVRQRQG
ncbi:MAG: hypothetical protein K2Z81_20375 [Cyanobacteria bacterium]|nr:hypothetical protein [Cyanobacteriota bacterium]